jgi:hypothetical protein
VAETQWELNFIKMAGRNYNHDEAVKIEIQTVSTKAFYPAARCCSGTGTGP